MNTFFKRSSQAQTPVVPSPAVITSPRPGKKTAGNQHQPAQVLLAIAVLFIVFTACGDMRPKTMYPVETAIIAAHRMPEVVANCTDRTFSYPTSYAREELQALAKGLQYVASQPNRDDFWLFLNTISSSSLTTGLPPIHLDRINADDPPPPPLVLPKQQPHENPYEYATKVAQLKKAYQQKIDQYQASLRKKNIRAAPRV